MTLIYTDSIGINLVIQTLFDLTGYDSVVLNIVKPSGTLVTATPVVYDVTSGELHYETVSGDLDESGRYRLQTKVTYGDGDVVYGEIATFKVYERAES